ncbi:MAG TPA: hypothetical protein VFA20_06570 [Myxococcaceae bacterium]|nr:hypothetical protein [Myxococcaceae bacterium]
MLSSLAFLLLLAGARPWRPAALTVIAPAALRAVGRPSAEAAGRAARLGIIAIALVPALELWESPSGDADAPYLVRHVSLIGLALERWRMSRGSVGLLLLPVSLAIASLAVPRRSRAGGAGLGAPAAACFLVELAFAVTGRDIPLPGLAGPTLPEALRLHAAAGTLLAAVWTAVEATARDSQSP